MSERTAPFRVVVVVGAVIIEWGTTGLRFKGHYAIGVGFAQVHVGLYTCDEPMYIQGSWRFLWGERG